MLDGLVQELSEHLVDEQLLKEGAGQHFVALLPFLTEFINAYNMLPPKLNAPKAPWVSTVPKLAASFSAPQPSVSPRLTETTTCMRKAAAKERAVDGAGLHPRRNCPTSRKQLKNQ
jgi:hypothetical protein